MADYSAKIELLIQGLDKLKALERRVSGLQKEAEKLSKPLMKKGTAALAEVIDEAADAQKGLNRQTESGLIRQIKLNSAVRLYERRLAEVGRTAASSQKQFAGDLEQIQQAFEVFKGKGSVRGVQAVSTELGRIIEYSREVTRLEVGRVKSSEQIKEFQRQINTLKASGLDVSKAEKTLEKFSVNAGTNKFKLAERYRIVLNGRLRQLRDELAIEKQIAREQSRRQQGRGQAIRGAASNALIGAGFPLLFGQGGAAALGGGLGGLAGGLLGGSAGFALSIVGTAIGQAVSEAEEFNKELAVLNARTRKLGSESQVTAKDVEQLARNLGVAKDQALEVLAAYSGFDSAKTKNALAVLYGDDSGLFASLAAAKDQASLAQVILGAYNKIGIERASQLIDQVKSGDLAAVELAFQQALLDVEIEKTKERLRQVTLQDRIIAGLASIGSVQGGGKFISPEVFGEERVRQFEAENKPSEIFTRALEGLNKLREATRTAESFNDTAGVRAAERAKKAQEAADTLTEKLQRQIELTTAKTAEDQKVLRILFEYRDNVKAIQKLENQSQAARQLKLANELYSLQLNRLATEELNKYLKTLTSIAAVSPGLGRSVFQGNALQSSLNTDVGLAFGTTANLAQVTPGEQQLQKAKKDLKELVDPINQVKTAAQSVGSAFSESFRSIISGSATAQEALANMFNRIADSFLEMAGQIITQLLVIKAIEMTIQSLGSSGSFKGFSGEGPVAYPSDLNIGVAGFRANGGPVNSGSTYMVGERGPELFVPGQSGMIVPNDMFEATRSAISGGGGGGAAAFDENREALNSVTTLNRERQVERLLTSGASSTEIRYSRVGSGDLPFVTEENMLQATRIAAQEGARLGQARTLAALKNNPGTRRTVGI